MRILVEATQIKHYVQDRLLLDVDKLQVYEGERIGLVGHNGSGKTTLLQILTEQLSAEQGVVTQYTRQAYIPQLKSYEMTKSGGEVMQNHIQHALSQQPELLFADEPTANLDTDHIEALENTLQAWTGAFVIISHDRAFLDALCTTIWELEDSKLTIYKGNYSDYVEQKALARRQLQQTHEKYEREKKHLEAAIRLKERKAQQATKKPRNLTSSEARVKGTNVYFANKQKKLRQTIKSMESRLDRLDKVEKVKDAAPFKMTMPYSEILKQRIIMRAEAFSGQIDNRVLWHPTQFNVHGGDKLAIMGANGSGKSTLIKQLLQQSSSVSISPSVKVGYFSQNLDILDADQTILENIQSTSEQDETLIRTVLARMHFFKDDVYKRVNVLSGGERVKVALVKIFVSDVNTLILDEPTNFLDMQAIEAFEALLREYEGTVIVVSHDRRFIEQVATRMMIIEDHKVKVFEGTYHQWKEAQVTAQKRDANDYKLLLEHRIADVLSRLSMTPSEALEQEFQELLKQKRELDE
ncbi:MAG: ABC-F type ribosomal protection protein [Staphylococcus rostri]|uniref:Vga family ABC-F type ribosomal protection protein n=1 Tax=Staphylococcus rostri TaxID=522262 RepID=UPI0026DEB38B|nr:ABC-F type ribosomal protection protein [Staphylococcus rostri]MDO5374850.1 ABC-F type ribosomal protection protein [Staphylococcus rostri]